MAEGLTIDWPSLIIGGALGCLFTWVINKLSHLLGTRLLNFVRRSRPPPSKKDPEYFKLGAFETQFLVIDGNGEYYYEPENLVCHIENSRAELPPEIIRIRDEVEKEQRRREAEGRKFEWNGPLWALERHNVTRTDPDEQMKLILTLRPTDHYTFQATVRSLDINLVNPPAESTLRQKYLHGHDPIDLGNNPVVFLANGLGVALAVITEDKKLLLARRSEKVGSRPGELDASVVEGVHPERDKADFFHAAYCGIEEELSVEQSDIKVYLLGFGVDMKYYQWNMIGVAYVKKTAQEVLESRSRGASGKWENRKFFPISIDLESILEYLKDREMWDMAWVTIYWALVYEWGKKRVDTEWEKILG